MYGQYTQPEPTLFESTVTQLTQAGMPMDDAVSMTLQGIWFANIYNTTGQWK